MTHGKIGLGSLKSDRDVDSDLDAISDPFGKGGPPVTTAIPITSFDAPPPNRHANVLMRGDAACVLPGGSGEKAPLTLGKRFLAEP